MYGTCIAGNTFMESGVLCLFDRFYHTMEYRNFLFTGMSFFLTGQIIHEYQDKIVCKRLEQWMQWGLKAGMIFGVALSMMEYAFRGAGEIYTGNCVAVICLFLWLILYGREINFPLYWWKPEENMLS